MIRWVRISNIYPMMRKYLPKYCIIELFRKLNISHFNSHFDASQIVSFLSNCDDPSIELFDVSFVEGNSGTKTVSIGGQDIMPIKRGKCRVSEIDDRLNIGRRGKLGGPSDGIAGIVDTDDMTAEEIINDAKKEFRIAYRQRKIVKDFPEGSTYPGETWFKYVKNRKPLLIVYLIDVFGEEGNEAVINKMKDSMNNVPSVGFAFGFPKNDSRGVYNVSVYRANKTYNYFERNDILTESEEEE